MKKFDELIKMEEKDACGIGFIAEMSGKPSRRVIELALKSLKRMRHRGASGADKNMSDGIGVLLEIPQQYFRQVLKEDFQIYIHPDKPLGIAMVFTVKGEEKLVEEIITNTAKRNKIDFVCLRNVPVNLSVLSENGKEICPVIQQFFFTQSDDSKYDFETQLYLLRKGIEKQFLLENMNTFICSLSSRTMVYKGMMKADQLSHFYQDLNDVDFVSRLVIFHERFSTNTISSWSMAQPFRMIGHNGEINTIKANRLWMQAREENMESSFWGKYIDELKPIVSQTGSDSYSFDNILEFLTKSGKNVIQAIMMLIPEPYEQADDMEIDLKNFYVFNENIIEPWDGPAALVFTDGKIVGAKLDRNGLRPLRYSITKDGLIIMASEAGVVDIEPTNVLMHHHMSSGEVFAMHLDGRGILKRDEIISTATEEGKYTKLIEEGLIELTRGTIEEEFSEFALPENGFDRRLRIAFGFDKEDFEKIIEPMSKSSKEPIGSMGDDTPLAVISNKNRKIYDYFKQYFAQVTNPPIDPIREKFVMNTYRYIGNERDLLSDSNSFRGSVRIESPILSPREMRILKEKYDWFPHKVINCNAHVTQSFKDKIDEIQNECEAAVLQGTRIIFLSNEGLNENFIPIPMLLVVSAVHQHLIKKKLRNRTALLCFSGDVIEDHHVACLVAFGASAVYPYMAYELIRENFEDDWILRMHNYRSALEKGLLKIMAKMGISTISSYHGSMLFHAVGISEEVIREYFPSVKSLLGGLTLEKIKELVLINTQNAFNNLEELQEIGRFRFRKDGEYHGFSPEVFKSIHKLAERKVERFNNENSVPIYIRDFLDIKKQSTIDDENVEPIEDILKRFGLGAISFGAVSEDVHRTLARAASILNIRSNTGEGGEQQDRYSISNPDKSENCYTKQIASGRFGVTTAYLSSAREIQIKIAQGAKPGEGGQLPGEKVTLEIANYRFTTPGVQLISPPPHHDIYSIEDIAELIYDLKQVNPRAKICVKLVSQYGVGIVASGVVKAGADVILISGNDGGTGASPLGSIKHTGLPWEIGLTEVHRTLCENGLRNHVILRVDGGLKSARDIIIAALLGAEEYDFGTAALISLGCVMARQCHLNTCPVGIATQDKELRKRFKGKPENLVNFIKSIAQGIREILADSGFFTLQSIIGRTDLLILNQKFEKEIKEKNISLEYFLNNSEHKKYNLDSDIKIKKIDHTRHIDEDVIEEVRQAIMTHGRVIVNRKINNTDRAVGTRLSGLIAFLYGDGTFKGNIQYRTEGAAGQSLGAFLVENVEIRHCGVANDYVGKGMNGGLISIRFPKEIRKTLEGNTLIGNVALYGATGGEMFVAGKAGERFAVRNSGAAAVVEGVGNHCCEYMTRGVVIILGSFGKNLGAGMTGGFVFVYNQFQNIQNFINKDYVRISSLLDSDYDLILRTLENHKFHTASPKAEQILYNWENEKMNFIKIEPTVIDSIDFNKIYEAQYENRWQGVKSV